MYTLVYKEVMVICDAIINNMRDIGWLFKEFMNLFLFYWHYYAINIYNKGKHVRILTVTISKWRYVIKKKKNK